MSQPINTPFEKVTHFVPFSTTKDQFAMPVVSYEHLRYDREHAYFERIKPVYEGLKEDNPQFSGLLAQDIANFYHLLSSAIRIDGHPNVRMIITKLQAKYAIDTPVSVFQFQSVLPRSLASNRTYFAAGKSRNELVVLVSQHFFNTFDFQEQIAILGHELCHLLLGHLEVPVKRIIRQKADEQVHVAFRIDLLKWSLCAEISSDLYALHAIDHNLKIFGTMLIKAYSGVTALDSFDLISILLKQYEDLALSVQTAELSAHPILPVRIKVLEELRNTRLFQSIGQEVSAASLAEMKAELNTMIDSVIEKVYPEMFKNPEDEEDPIYLKAATAVTLADGVLTEAELTLVARRFTKDIHSKAYISSIRKRCDKSSPQQVANELITEALLLAQESNMNRTDVLPVLKLMLYIAVSDGLTLDELRLIHEFARHFEISKEEVIVLMHHLHQIN